MTDTIQQFFSAWGEPDADLRRNAITAAMAEGFTYADPRSDGTITTVDALDAYIGQFTEMAPGWTAKVVQKDGHSSFTRVIVSFGDNGDAAQHGTYFAAQDDDGRLTQLVGFSGAEGIKA